MDDSSGRVLVVGATHTWRAHHRRALEHMGLALTLAADGIHGLAVLQQHGPFDLMLLDLGAAAGDVSPFFQVVRKQFAELPVIVLTEQYSAVAMTRLLLLGAHAVMRASCTPDELTTAVTTAVHARPVDLTTMDLTALHPLILISERLNRQLDLPGLYEQIVATACEALHAAQVVLVRSTADTHVTAVAGAASSLNDARIWQPIVRWVDSHCEMVVLGAGREAPPGLKLPALTAASVLIAAPLVANDRTLGVLLVAIDGGPTLSLAAPLELIAALTRLAAVALENAERHTAVARSEARSRALLEHARDAVLLLNHDATALLEANAALVRLSGYTRDELLALAPTDLIATMAEFATPTAPASEFESRMRTRDGQELHVAVGVSDIVHEDAHYRLLIVRDISERQRLVHQWMQTEKLSGMGRVSASIAHEVNNPLQGLQSSLSLLVERSMSEEKRSQLLHMAQEQVHQLISVVQHMMDLHRPINEGMRPVSLHEVIESVLALLGPRLHEHRIVVARDLDSALPRVRAVSSQLKQVMVNLVLNAIEAMTAGGTLTVRTRTAGVLPAREVVIDVADTGRGIAADKLQHIFEPFYSTSSERTGLSLAVSYTIIEQHRGTIRVQSSDQGTTFSVVFPASER